MTQFKDFKYVLMRMKIKDDSSEEIKSAVLIGDWNVKQLVGEFKIMVDKMKMNIKLTDNEQEEHRKYIKEWEHDLYD